MISIIIPVYNQANKIGQCFDSILGQTILAKGEKLEVIVVNDGSKDNIISVINDHHSLFEVAGINFQFLSQENKGANAARNRGAGEANGEYIIFCDADVIMNPEMLETMKKNLETNPEASYAYSSFFWGRKKFPLWTFDSEKLKQMPYIHTTSLIKREYFPGFDANLKRLQDWDLWLTMLSRGHKGVWVNKPLFKVLTGGIYSNWLPKIAYKLMPFLGQVKKYNEAVKRIKEKHNL